MKINRHIKSFIIDVTDYIFFIIFVGVTVYQFFAKVFNI